MTLQFGSPDLLPYVCAVYVCSECGGSLAQHGRAAGELPADWIELLGQPDAEFVCANCRPVRSREPVPSRVH